MPPFCIVSLPLTGTNFTTVPACAAPTPKAGVPPNMPPEVDGWKALPVVAGWFCCPNMLPDGLEKLKP